MMSGIGVIMTGVVCHLIDDAGTGDGESISNGVCYSLGGFTSLLSLIFALLGWWFASCS
jgi:hypothetical protein